MIDRRSPPAIAVLTDLWPSLSEPHSGSFVWAQTRELSRRFRHVVLVPRLLVPRVHRRVWGRAPQGWQQGWWQPVPPGRLIRYPFLRIPKGGESEVRALGARMALARAGEHPAIVHGHFLHEVGVAAVRVALILDVPAVVSVHGTDARWLLDGGVQRRYRLRMLEAARAADRVLVVERRLAERLVDAGVPVENVRVQPMGVDEAVFTPRPRADARRELGLEPERRLVLFVGRPTAEKGIGELDRALASVDAECVAVGPPGRAERIRFVGAEPPERVALWLTAADLLCLPSHAEGMPVSVVEALACGRPVVASAVGGIPEQVEDGVTGLLVQPEDADALAEALRAALDRAWDEQALREASKPFWWSGLGGRLTGIYEELL